jgi:MATE family multidrug resistance protein
MAREAGESGGDTQVTGGPEITSPTRRLRLMEVDRAIFRIAIPALGSLAIDPLLTLTDTAFVARLGTTELAALGVDAAILTFAFFAFNFLAFVTTPLIAKAIGKGDNDEARRYVGTALFLAVVLGIFITAVVVFLAPSLVSAMGAEGAVASAAVGYLRIRACAAVMVLVVIVGHGAFRGHKDTRTPLIVALGVNTLNLVLDPLLIFGLGWGLAGAAWATVSAQTIGALWFVLLIRRRRMARAPESLRDSLPALVTLGRNGSLLIVRSAFLLATFTMAASTATRLGPDHIAAHQLVAQFFLLSAMVADALEISGQALVAEESAGGDILRLRALSRRLLSWGVVVGILLFLLVGLGRHLLALLASDEVVADLVVTAGGIAALVIPLAAVVFVADGVFVGLFSLGTMALSTALGAVVSVSLMLWSPLGSNLQGVWWALGMFMLGRGLVFVAGYRRSTEIAVRS